MLLANPKGLSSYEIFDRLADDRSNMRWLPSRNAIGAQLASIVGVESISLVNHWSGLRHERREVVLWGLNVQRFNEWRNKDAR